MEIVFWQNMPSHHQSGAIRSLSNILSGEVYGVYDTDLLSDRKMQGWQRPHMGVVKCTFLDQQTNPDLTVSTFIKQHPDAIHIFGGFRGCYSVELAWRELRKQPDAHLVCIAERPHFEGKLLEKLLARIWYRIFFLRFAHKFKALFAMGKLGVECFTSLGFPKGRIFPFIYQVDGSSSTFFPEASSSSLDSVFTPQCVKFVYIGGFSERKGVDIILNAFAGLPGLWKLDWIGCGGPLEPMVKNFADGNRIRFLGSIPSDQVIETLHGYDVCLVPSRHDGWGVVVNEALMAGCGVITSDNVGASELIIASGAGRVIPADNVSALQETLLDILARPKQVTDWALRAISYRQVIAPEVIGCYLHDVLRHLFEDYGSNKPSALWITEQ